MPAFLSCHSREGGNPMRRRQLFFCPCGAMDTHLRGYDDRFFFFCHANRRLLLSFLPSQEWQRETQEWQRVVFSCPPYPYRHSREGGNPMRRRQLFFCPCGGGNGYPPAWVWRPFFLFFVTPIVGICCHSCVGRSDKGEAGWQGGCFPLPPHGKNNKKAIKKPPCGGLFISVNRIQQPILGTFVQDMVRLQMQVHEQMSL